MSDSDSQSPPPEREGFERRWIKNDQYSGPERRSGGDRRRHPPVKEPKSSPDSDSPREKPPGKFRPYRP
jgi:hypothetical protein